MKNEHRRIYRHQSLNFEAPFAIGAPLNTVRAPVDVVVEVTDPLVSSGELASPAEPGEPEPPYSFYNAGDHYVLRIARLCRFRVNRDAGTVICEPEPEADLGWLPLFMAGSVTSLLLTIRGYAVLHGSAVLWDEGTVVFIGPAGKGKTTMAALACAAGAQLVADDLVPLGKAGGYIACSGVGHELRLREAAWDLAGLFPQGTPLAETKDGRLALHPPAARSELNPISAVVIPRPVEGATSLTTRQLPPALAVAGLLANARTPSGLSATGREAAYFKLVSELAASVPVLEAFVPWGPPWSARFVTQLLEELCAQSGLQHRVKGRSPLAAITER